MTRIARVAVLAALLALVPGAAVCAPARAETWECEAVAQPPQPGGPRCSSFTFSTQDYGVTAFTDTAGTAGSALSAAAYQRGNESYPAQDFYWVLDSGTMVTEYDPYGVLSGLCIQADAIADGSGFSLEACDFTNPDQRFSVSAYGFCSGADNSLGLVMYSYADRSLAIAFTGGGGLELKTYAGGARQCVTRLD